MLEAAVGQLVLVQPIAKLGETGLQTRPDGIADISGRLLEISLDQIGGRRRNTFLRRGLRCKLNNMLQRHGEALFHLCTG